MSCLSARSYGVSMTTQSLDEELLPKHEPLPKITVESLKDIYRRMPGVSRGCANSIYLQGFREGLREARTESLAEIAKLKADVQTLFEIVESIGLRSKGREPFQSDDSEVKAMLAFIEDQMDKADYIANRKGVSA